jgi:anaerobic carbon-monoxide dehydrogenase iron sulfur subunit
MTAKMLSLDPTKCTGCKECEIACSKRHGGFNDSVVSRIPVISEGNGSGFYLPTTCQHCEDPPCLSICPNKAIYRDNDLNRVMIRSNLCIGCRMCVSACPFGAMGFNPDSGLAFKCDLCDGDPACVRACEPKALDYVEGHRLHQPRMLDSANKHYRVLRRMII